NIRLIHLVLITLSTLLNIKSATAEPVTISSTNEQTYFLELYTSQGCSSCPPAEEWISQFTDHDKLWKNIIPLNFHVDYWDYLGWKDPFASPEFSRRQRTYAKLGNSRTVATPGFIVDGKGWQGWFRGQGFPAANIKSTDTLTATINETQVKVNFDTVTDNDLIAHVALLGFDIKTKVKAGENNRRLLNHDFVVIGYQQKEMTINNASSSVVDLPFPPVVNVDTDKTAMVVWVSTKENPTPIQVAADWYE
ncbi:MAG: DUF1223 domain-containing protein, partial [Nonlabens ulvanivorans]|uniref:DUF1223 domain-containing protein n=1 Tax=Nonlabens ulvanivorans TaxID=906888 RepID=UPI0032633F22